MAMFYRSDRVYLDEDLEKMKEIPPLEEAIDRIKINCHEYLLSTFILIAATGYGTSWHNKYGDNTLVEQIGILKAFLVVLLVLLFDEFLARKKVGWIAIYPEMMVVYYYDDDDTKRARPFACRYWTEVVQYGKDSPAIWFNSVDKDPWISNFKMKKLRPYLEQYAPHAQAVKFSVIAYDEKKEKEWEKQWKAEKRKEKDIKIWERKRAKMAAKEEKQKEKMAASAEITPEQKSEPRETDIHRE